MRTLIKEKEEIIKNEQIHDKTKKTHVLIIICGCLKER